MNVLVVNRGSSSLKLSLYLLDRYPDSAKKAQWQAHLEWKNKDEDFSLKILDDQAKEHVEKSSFQDQKSALRYMVSLCPHLSAVDAVGHRIVHGGAFYKESVRIDRDVKKNIELLKEMAPLHNQADLEGIELLEKLLPSVVQIAVFDTAFHHSLPKSAAVYPGPYSWFEEGIRRYGFHGVSFQYCSKRAAEILKRELLELNMVICHLGSGASLCAIQGGKSIDTTMGFTPLEGLMMDTRSGSVDPGILLYLLAKKGRSEKSLSQELYEKSGLLGLSGISSDMRDLLEKAHQGDARAKLAIDVYLHRLCKEIAAMAASLKGIDTLVFTAGIGENAALLRERACKSLSFLGVDIDPLKNLSCKGCDCVVSLGGSKVNVLVIQTHEALEIARECWRKLKNE